MKTLIIYDSAYGNTAKVAQAISKNIAKSSQVVTVPVQKYQATMLEDIDLLVVGSPTQGGRPTVDIQQFVSGLTDLFGMKVAAFDTRFATRGHGVALGLLMKTIGYAAEKISRELTSKGGVEVLPPAGFIVSDKTGPLKAGELDRAAAWIQDALEYA